MAADPSHSQTSFDLPLVPGAVAGVVSFVAGYVLTFLVKAGDVSELFTRSLGEAQGSGVTPPGDWQVIGWFFFQMHNVATETTITAGPLSETGTTSGSVESWLLLLPVVLLVGAGFVVARRTNTDDIVAGSQAGVMVILGYLALAVVLVLLSTWSASVSALGGTASVSIGPTLVTGVLTAGIIYPLICGGIGGALAAATAQ